MAAAQQAGFDAGDDAPVHQRVKTGLQPLHLRQPHHGVQIAQTAAAVFHVRLQNQRRPAGVAALHFYQLGFDKSRGVALRVQLLAQTLRQRFFAAQQSCFEKSGVGRNILRGGGAQLFQAA